MANKRFPHDCQGCKHYVHYDMSVDDWTSICDYMHTQVDDCDSDNMWCYCTLSEQQKEDEENAEIH